MRISDWSSDVCSSDLPYKFEVEATAYIGQSGQTGARLEAEYDTLLTNRLILQWQVEAELYGQDDARRGIGSGLSTAEAGLRLRYELRREFEPYIGVARERAYGGKLGRASGRGRGWQVCLDWGGAGLLKKKQKNKEN